MGQMIIDGSVVMDPEGLADLRIAWPDPMHRIFVQVVNVHLEIPGQDPPAAIMPIASKQTLAGLFPIGRINPRICHFLFKKGALNLLTRPSSHSWGKPFPQLPGYTSPGGSSGIHAGIHPRSNNFYNGSIE